MIDLGKQYRTRDGREVRIYAVDGGLGKNVHGAIKESYGWHERAWDSHGQHCTAWPEVFDNRHSDLIEVKPKITRTYWLCHTSNATDCNLYGWTDKAEAEKWARQVNRTVSITGPHAFEFTEGDGL